ncbi:hypothetical protein SCHPADRAFT_823476 [Schizopora paradoxa]|uniref:Metallo-beta-lactamase domain-containing protein n=1 Tax=Schizopora paradoxa TaxID=27342 RepID=A0A0H2RWN3_9AGAM|nr:hypothetical protein SCHPADRAFT_823476 [Schizopora paradoxa]
MSNDFTLTFLGTSSGGGPNDTRSCSSLALEMNENGELWLVDCAEGTLRQFSLQPERDPRKRLSVNSITKLFITHLHFDHVMGIITVLAKVLRGGFGDPIPPRTIPVREPRIELYGPAGLRTFVRSILKMTGTELTERYAVHELLTPSDIPTTCSADEMHFGELPGRDIVCNANSIWSSFESDGDIQVDAGPLAHRVSCLGYVFREVNEVGRKVVILGDTCNPSAMTAIARNASLLVHEATDAHIPFAVDRSFRGDKKSERSIEERTIAKGHSTPGMAGAFAKSIRARRLVLNHFSGKFPAPVYKNDRRKLVMAEIERQASQAWGHGKAVAAYDFMQVVVPAPSSSRTSSEFTGGSTSNLRSPRRKSFRY